LRGQKGQLEQALVALDPSCQVSLNRAERCACNGSLGAYVRLLPGIPCPVIHRAQEILMDKTWV